MKIGFLGAGNMGGSILNGYANSENYGKDEIYIFGVNKEKLEKNCEKYRAEKRETAESLVSSADIIFLGIKPNKFDEIMPKIAKEYVNSKIIVSMAAGISIGYIKGFLGEESKVIRIMPNTPAMIGKGITSLSVDGEIPRESLDKVKEILESTGKVVEIPERLIHSVIGASGSSPAYTYLYIDSLIDAAMSYGMEYGEARIFAAQSVIGAASMVLHSDKSLSQLAEDVCSPGGTTIEAVNFLKENNFKEIVETAAIKAIEKSKKLER